MRLVLALLALFLVFPVHGGKLVIEPGKLSFLSPNFSFHTEDRTFSYIYGPLSYGRLDINSARSFLKDPHGARYSVDLEAKDSVRQGVRGLVYDSYFLDFSLGLGTYPTMDMKLQIDELDLLLNLERKEEGKRNVITNWSRVLPLDIFSLAVVANSEIGLKVTGVLSLSPDYKTRLFTGLSGEFENISFRLGRGRTLVSKKKIESSYSLNIHTESGNIWISGLTGIPSSRPSVYTEAQREMGLSLKLGKLEIGRSYKVDMTSGGTWRKSGGYYLDMSFARLSYLNGKIRFSMEPVNGFSIGIGAQSTSISFRYNGIEIKRTSRGEWSFRVSVEMT